MIDLSTSRVFGADINDARYFELSKYAFDNRNNPDHNSSKFFSPEFQKKVSYWEEKRVFNRELTLDGTEFNNISNVSVTRSSHVRKYKNDIFVHVVQYVFRFVANNSLYIRVTSNDYTTITNFVSKFDYTDWSDVTYSDDDRISICLFHE